MARNPRRLVVNLGPQHPSTHGVLHLEVELEGEEIVAVDTKIGYLHRCFEKHCEYLSYPQIIPFTDRLDYLASMNNSHAFVMGIEKLLGLDKNIPDTVEYIRVLVCELNRVASHLIALGTFAMDLGSVTPFMWCFIAREKIVRLLEKASGARLLYNYIWIGGLFYKLPRGFCEETLACVVELRQDMDNINRLLLENNIFIKRTCNIGVITQNQCEDYAITGPMQRACGIPFDLRKQDAYSVYPKLEFEIPSVDTYCATLGDCWSRCYIRAEEIKQSLGLIEQCCDFLLRMPSSSTAFDPHALVPKKVRMKSDAEIYSRAENPRGELGFFIATQKNSDVPLRVKVRAPSFSNLSILPVICPGHFLADLPVILGSFDIVLGEIDR